MTTLSERARSLVWAGAFLVELAKDESLPIAVRRTAVVIARHRRPPALSSGTV
jgi:hypothetical protein